MRRRVPGFKAALLGAAALCILALLPTGPGMADEGEDADPVELSEEAQACLECHADQAEAKGHLVDGRRFMESVHKEIDCTDCHSDFETYPHSEDAETESCEGCHDDMQEAIAASVHGGDSGPDDPRGAKPKCADCHGIHDIFPKDDPRSRRYHFNVPRICGKCHADGMDVENATAEELLQSRYTDDTHGHGLLQSGLLCAPNCVTCHGSHDIKASTDPESRLHPNNVSEKACGTCHVGVLNRYRESIHGRTPRGSPEQNGNHREPATCTDCHQPHGIRKADQHFKLEIIETCSKCHGDRGHTYRGTYHGRITQLGFGGVASCDECHTAHDILPVSDPASSLHPDNRVETCAKCHEGATPAFAEYAVHADPLDKENWPLLYWARSTMRLVIFATWGMWLLHMLLWLPGLIRERKKIRAATKSVTGRWYRRWPWSYRAIHLTLVCSFLLLALTGLPLRFHDAPWSSTIFGMLGGAENVRFLHRTGAALTFGYALAFVVMLVMRRIRGERGMIFGPNTLLPNFKDLQDLRENIRWSFKGGPSPRFGRWTYYEKFDFLAEVWGVLFIGLTGLVMWFPEFFTTFLPGEAINLAHILHSYEALLATSFIFTMHFFNANLRPGKFPVDTLFLTGRITEEELRHERPDEYERMKREGRLDSEAVRRPNRRLIRRAKFLGGILMAIGITLLLLMASTLFL